MFPSAHAQKSESHEFQYRLHGEKKSQFAASSSTSGASQAVGRSRKRCVSTCRHCSVAASRNSAWRRKKGGCAVIRKESHVVDQGSKRTMQKKNLHYGGFLLHSALATLILLCASESKIGQK